MREKAFAWLMTFAMLLSLLPAAGLTALAAEKSDVQYIDADGVEQTCVSAEVVEETASRVTWNTGWYVVDSKVAIPQGVDVSGEVHLILADGASLTISNSGTGNAGIKVNGTGNSLTIYGQSEGTGKLTVTGGTGGAGIGGGNSGNGSNITINGGTVTATGGSGGAGIGNGAGSWGPASNIKIAPSLTVKAGTETPPTTVISNNGDDLADSLKEKRYVKVEKGAGHTHSDTEMSFETKLTADGGTLSSGSYYLDSDLTLTNNLTISSGATVNLCLNGHVLKGNGTGSVITNKGTLNICDCNGTAKHYFKVASDGLWAWSPDETSGTDIDDLTARPETGTVIAVPGGCITGGNWTGGTERQYGGGVASVGESTCLTLKNVNIIGNAGDLSAGSVLAQGCSKAVNISGGIFAGCTTNCNGGAVYIREIKETNSTITGTKIMFNTSKECGGGIAVYNTALTIKDATIRFNKGSYGGGVGIHKSSGWNTSLNISGTTLISDNSASDNGGGVYVASKSTLKTGGTVVIKDNKSGETVQNVYLPSGKTITVDTPQTGMSIGVTTQTDPTANNPVSITGNNGGSDYKQYFTSDKGYVVINGTKNIVKLHQHGSWTYEADGAVLTAKCSGESECGKTMLLTLTANGATYTGSAYTGASLSDTTEWEKAGLDIPTIEYYSGETKLEGGAPTDAGIYTAKITAGTDAGAVTATEDFTISPKSLTVDGTTVADKKCDGTTSATVTIGTVTGVVDGDSVTVNATGAFADSSVGTHNVTVTYTLTGEDAPNYSAPAQETLYARIFKRSSGNMAYRVTISDAAKNQISSDKIYANKGQTVTLTVQSGVESVIVKDSMNASIPVEKGSDTTYTFPMPASNVTVSTSSKAEQGENPAPVADTPFTDVGENDFFYEPVLWAVEKGIANGMTETTFCPFDITTRAQMVTFLWRAAGSPEPSASATNPFVDVNEGDYFYKAVLWGHENGYVKGTSETTFDPDLTVTRGQAVTFLARMAGVMDEATGYTHSFTDVPADAYYNNSIAWASWKGIANGIGEGLFAPDKGCARGEVVTFLYRNANP